MPEDFINKTSRKQKFVTGGILLVILEIIFTYLAIVSYNNKNLDKYIFGSKDLKNTELFAVMVEDNNGDYKQQSNFPDFPYQFNISKSNCIDNEGNTIKDSLLFDEEKREVIVKTNKTASCYLFFNKSKEAFAPSLINSGELWSSGLEGDGYRYTGSGAYNSETSPSNFICFGTSDKTECKNNEAKYMYRIIGVFPDSSGTQHLKLISLKQLGSYKWNDTNADVNWGSSTLFTSLNGSGFLTNSIYDYLQNNTWLNKIEDWTWSAVNTKTRSDSGPDYYGITTQEMYLHEMNRSSKTSSIGEWSTPTAKIGLMYASDYQMSLGSSSLSYRGYATHYTLITGWMHQSNNDTSKDINEWTLSRIGEFSGYFYVWYVSSDGIVRGSNNVNNPIGARPVFHLTSDVEKLSGKGSYDDPFILRETNENKLKVSASLNSSTMTASITKSDYDLNKYCINNSPSITGCTWNKVTSTTIATEVNEGYTYIHIVDKGGYLVHGSVYYELPKLNNYLIDNAGLWQSGLEDDGYRYVGSGAYNSETTPSNFICFGTSDKTECKNNEAKYMYRIIGVFEGTDGNQHLKLISLKQLGSYKWNADSSIDVAWENSDMYTGLNGSYFLTNTTYDYLQNNTWLNKIEDWTWSSVNTKTYSDSGPYYYNSLSPSQIYLHEMNRSSKTSSIGEWTNPTAKIGLMYASDYTLSLGSSALAITGDTYTNRATLKTGWMHQSNNDTTSSTTEWTLSRVGGFSGSFYAWLVDSDGDVGNYYVDNTYRARPVFHLKDNVKYKFGSGTYADPYIINE